MSIEWAVGQEVVIRRTRGEARDKVARVYKVGRKYGYAKPDDHPFPDVQFRLDTGYENSDYSAYYRVVTPELLADEDRRASALARVTAAGFKAHSSEVRGISTDVLERIADLLDGAR